MKIDITICLVFLLSVVEELETLLVYISFCSRMKRYSE
uniref:Uncharacterized protein n=1 Tax=Arundo donax TaxID=35708 RepID=A0A0A9H4I0_ARUDO